MANDLPSALTTRTLSFIHNSTKIVSDVKVTRQRLPNYSTHCTWSNKHLLIQRTIDWTSFMNCNCFIYSCKHKKYQVTYATELSAKATQHKNACTVCYKNSHEWQLSSKNHSFLNVNHDKASRRQDINVRKTSTNYTAEACKATKITPIPFHPRWHYFHPYQSYPVY